MAYPELPEPVIGWPMVDQIRWILAQPGDNDVKLTRLVHFVRAEKEKSAEVAQSIYFH